MRAVFLPGGREAVVREIEVPRPGDGEVLLAMKAAGLCGSDLHMHYRIAPENRHGAVFGLRTDPGVVPGHEPAGVVAEVGEGVWHLRPGDRVAVHHMAGCGVCVECRRGWDINCQHKWGTYGLDHPGAMQDFMVVRARDCVRVPDSVSLAEAAYYTCGAGTGYLALKRAGFGLGDTVAVVGLGPVGVAGAYFAASAGARVVGIDTLDERCRFAESSGIGYTTNPNSEDAAEAVRQATGGKGADVVLETSGSAAGRLLALDIAAIRGRVVCVGFADATTTLDVQAAIIQKQLDLLGAWMFPITSLQELLDDVGLRGFSIRNLIPNSFPVTDAAAAWRAFDAGSLGKTIIAWPE